MNVDLLRDHVGGALDLDLMEHHVDGAAGAVARGLAAEIDGDADLDPLRLVDPHEIDMERLDAVRIPLEVSEQGAGLHRAFQFDDAAAMADDRFKRLTTGGEVDTLLSVPVQNGGDEPLATESAGLAGTGGGTGNNF